MDVIVKANHTLFEADKALMEKDALIEALQKNVKAKLQELGMTEAQILEILGYNSLETT